MDTAVQGPPARRRVLGMAGTREEVLAALRGLDGLSWQAAALGIAPLVPSPRHEPRDA
jgi:hypothetical protein